MMLLKRTWKHFQVLFLFPPLYGFSSFYPFVISPILSLLFHSILSLFPIFSIFFPVLFIISLIAFVIPILSPLLVVLSYIIDFMILLASFFAGTDLYFPLKVPALATVIVYFASMINLSRIKMSAKSTKFISFCVLGILLIVTILI